MILFKSPFLYTLVLSIPLILGCSESNSNTTPSSFQFYYTGNLIGSIDPCNCKGAPLGGFARRATKMKEAGVSENSLLVDAGSFVSLSQKQSLEKTILVLSGLKKLGVDAISIGYRDTHRLKATELKEMAKEFDFPFISANLVSFVDESPLFPAYKIVAVDGERGDFNVAIIGVVQGGPYREIPAEQGMKITDPVEAIVQTVPKVSKTAQFIVLLTDAPQPTVSAWLAQIENNEIDIVLTSSGRLNHKRSVDLEGVPLFSAGKQGKYFDVIKAEPGTDKWTISREYENLGPTIKDDEVMASFINEMIDRLGITER